MIALTDAILAASATPPPTPLGNPGPPPPRTVEASERGDLNADADADADPRRFGNEAAIVEILRTSAREFELVLESLEDVHAAGALSGFNTASYSVAKPRDGPAAPGSDAPQAAPAVAHVDQYA